VGKSALGSVRSFLAGSDGLEYQAKGINSMQSEKAKFFLRWLVGLIIAGLSIWLLIKDLDWFSVLRVLAEAGKVVRRL